MMPIKGNICDEEIIMKALELHDEHLNETSEKNFEIMQNLGLEDYPFIKSHTDLEGHDFKNVLVKYSSEIQESLKLRIADISNGKMDPPVSYDDGDQSPMMDFLPQMFLKIEWVHYTIDYYPMAQPWMSDWSRVLFTGNYQQMMDILEEKSEEETERLLNKRESFASLGKPSQIYQRKGRFSQFLQNLG